MKAWKSVKPEISTYSVCTRRVRRRRLSSAYPFSNHNFSSTRTKKGVAPHVQFLQSHIMTPDGPASCAIRYRVVVQAHSLRKETSAEWRVRQLASLHSATAWYEHTASHTHSLFLKPSDTPCTSTPSHFVFVSSSEMLESRVRRVCVRP